MDGAGRMFQGEAGWGCLALGDGPGNAHSPAPSASPGPGLTRLTAKPDVVSCMAGLREMAWKKAEKGEKEEKKGLGRGKKGAKK